jgi:hypothetical protein
MQIPAAKRMTRRELLPRVAGGIGKNIARPKAVLETDLRDFEQIAPERF